MATKARKVLIEDPELAEILGEISYRKKEYVRAIQLSQESARRRPLDARALFYLGMSQLATKQESEGRETLKRALAAALDEPRNTGQASDRGNAKSGALSLDNRGGRY